MPFWPDSVEEILKIDFDTHRRSTARRQADAMTVGQARLLGSYSSKFPWLEPGIMLSLAQAGVDTDDPAAEWAAEQSARLRADSALGFRQPGETVRAGAVSGEPMAVDELSAAIRGSRFFDPETGTLVRRSSNGDAFDREARRLAEQLGRNLTVGVPFFDEERGSFFLQPAEGERMLASQGFMSASTGLNRGGIPLARMREIANRTGPPSLDDSEDAFARLSFAEQQALVANAAQSQEMKLVRGPSGLLGTVAAVAQPLIQTGFMALDAPVQELQGQFRNVVGAARGEDVDFGESQSDLGILIGSEGKSNVSDAGGGFFVDQESPVALERKRRELERGTIDGHAITIGRFAADIVTEPGTTPFRVLSGLVDAGVQIGADPSSVALGKLGQIGRARTVFRSADDALDGAGAIRGIRRMVHGPTAETWLNGEEGAKVVDWMTATSRPGEILRGTNWRIPVADANRIADATEAAEVSDILRPLLGTTVRETTELPTFARSRQSVRLFNRVPGNQLDTFDQTQAVRGLEDFLSNVKVDGATIDNLVDRMARAETRNAMFDVVTDAMTSSEGVLTARYGIARPVARRLTRLWTDSIEDSRKGFVDEIGHDAPNWETMMNDGVETAAGGPHLLLEHLGQFIPLPDPRAIRREASAFRHILADAEGELRAPLSTMMWLQDKIWKPAQLLRLAWPIRVIGEEQVRMAAAGLDSMFHHPLSFMAYVIGRKGTADLAGDAFSESEAFRRAMTRGSGGWREKPNGVRTGMWTTFAKTDDEIDRFMPAWADELALLHADPISRTVATSETLDDAVDWLTKGAGQKWRREMGDAHPEILTQAGARRYVESISQRIAIKTGGDTDLLDAVRTGRLGDISMATGSTKIDGAFVKALDGYVDAAPAKVKGEAVVYRRGNAETAREFDRYDRAVEWMFGFLMSKRTNQLSRSPTFRQAYWGRVDELMPKMSIDAQQATIRAAQEAGLDAKQIAALRRARKVTGDLSIDEADALAKGHALDFTKNLLYDLSEKSQFFDITRLLFPFGEAWKEVITRWSRLVQENPATIRRAQQVIQGARGEDLGEVVGAPAGEGFFYTNTNGEEVFTYPGSEWFTSKTIGVPVPLVGRVQGLSLATQVMPGIGPVAQIPVGFFMPDTPEWRDVRQLLLPFGAPAENVGDVIDPRTWSPAWMRRIFDAEGGRDGDSVRLFANTTMDMARYLYSTGEYGNSREEQQRMMEDARGKARDFYVIRAITQFGAPSAPAPEFLVEDDTGKTHLVSLLTEEYQKLLDDDFQTASQTFLERYGELTSLVLQNKSVSLVVGLPATRQAADWLHENPEIRTELPATYGLFAPSDGDFDYQVYIDQFARGDRVAMSPEQWRKAGNNLMGSIQYQQAKDQVGNNPPADHRAWLREWHDHLVEAYPGFDEPSGVPERADTEQKVREMIRAAEIPELAETDAGQGLVEYLEVRRLATEQALAAGYSGFGQAQALAGTRAWLRDHAETIIARHPDFAPLFIQVLEREMIDIDEEQEAA